MVKVRRSEPGKSEASCACAARGVLSPRALVILQKRLKKFAKKFAAADPTRRIGVIEGLFLSHRGMNLARR